MVVPLSIANAKESDRASNEADQKEEKGAKSINGERKGKWSDA